MTDSNKHIEALHKSWKFSQSGVYRATDFEKKIFAQQVTDESQLESNKNTNGHHEDIKQKPKNEYDEMLKIQMTSQYGSEDTSKSADCVADGKISAKAENKSASPLQSLMSSFNQSKEKPSVDLSNIQSPVLQQLRLQQAHLQTLQEVANTPEQCPDDELSKTMTPQKTVGLSHDVLTARYNKALQKSIEGHQLAERLPQTDAFQKSHNAYASGLSTLMPFARSHPELSSQMMQADKQFQTLSAHLSRMPSSNEANFEIKDTDGRTSSAMEKHAEVTHNLVNNLQSNINQTSILVAKEKLAAQVQDMHKNLYRSALDLSQVGHGLSMLTKSSLHDDDTSNQPISLKDLHARARNSAAVIKSVQQQYQDAQTNTPTEMAYAPMSNLTAHLKANQLDENSVNQQIINYLMAAIEYTEHLSSAKECPDFQASGHQQSLVGVTSNLENFGEKFEVICQASPAAAQEGISQVSTQLTSVNQTLEAHLNQMDNTLKQSNEQMTSKINAYNNSASKLEDAQSALQSQMLAGSAEQGLGPAEAEAQLAAKQAKAQAALAEAQAKYDDLLAVYQNRLAALEAMAAKLKEALQAKLDMAANLMNGLSDDVSQKFCGKSLEDLLEAASPCTDIASLPPGCLKAIGAISAASQGNSQKAMDAQDQYEQGLMDPNQLEDDLSTQGQGSYEQGLMDPNQLEDNLSTLGGGSYERNKAMLNDIAEFSKQTYIDSQSILGDVDRQVNEGVDGTHSSMENLMSLGTEAIKFRLETLALKLKTLMGRFPSCPNCSDELNENYQKVETYLKKMQCLENLTGQMQDNADQLLAVRDQALTMQSSVNNLQNNCQNIQSPQSLAEGTVQMYAAQIPPCPEQPDMNQTNAKNLAAMLGFEMPELPDLSDLMAIQAMVPQLTDILNKATGALACMTSAAGMFLDSGSGPMAAVSSGAQMKCMMGGPPGQLNVIPFGVNISPGKPATLPINIVPFLNIKPFSPCTNPANPLVIASLGAPSTCIPLNIPWLPLAAKTQGMGMPLVRENSQLHCAFTAMTGMTTVSKPGQDEIKVV